MPVVKAAEDLDWSEDWTTWLAGDLISSSTWSTPAGLLKGPDGFTNTITTVRLPAGSTPGKYVVTNTITTVAGDTGVRTRKFRVRT